MRVTKPPPLTLEAGFRSLTPQLANPLFPAYGPTLLPTTLYEIF
jgi:hypothetical protein